MSAIEMSLYAKFPYQRLKHEGGLDAGERERERPPVVRSRTWYRLKRVSIRRRLRLKVPSLSRYLRKFRLVSSARLPFVKVLKRLRENQEHLGDLFAGNYLFMQVTPSSLKCHEKSGHQGPGLHGFPSSGCSVPRIA